MATKKAPVKKKATAKTTKRKKTTAKSPAYETLKLTKKDVPFFGIRLTVQTFYWTVISLLVLIFGLWIIYLQYSVYNLYQRLEVDRQTTTIHAPYKQ